MARVFKDDEDFYDNGMLEVVKDAGFEITQRSGMFPFFLKHGSTTKVYMNSKVFSLRIIALEPYRATTYAIQFSNGKFFFFVNEMRMFYDCDQTKFLNGIRICLWTGSDTLDLRDRLGKATETRNTAEKEIQDFTLEVNKLEALSQKIAWREQLDKTWQEMPHIAGIHHDIPAKKVVALRRSQRKKNK